MFTSWDDFFTKIQPISHQKWVAFRPQGQFQLAPQDGFADGLFRRIDASRRGRLW